jgi:hypothetical protein
MKDVENKIDYCQERNAHLAPGWLQEKKNSNNAIALLNFAKDVRVI